MKLHQLFETRDEPFEGYETNPNEKAARDWIFSHWKSRTGIGHDINQFSWDPKVEKFLYPLDLVLHFEDNDPLKKFPYNYRIADELFLSGTIESLQNLPDGFVNLIFFGENTKVKSLVGCPKTDKDFLIRCNSPSIELLSLDGCPEVLHELVVYLGEQTGWVEKLPTEVKYLEVRCPKNSTSLSGIHNRVKKATKISISGIKSNILGLMLIPGMDFQTNHRSMVTTGNEDLIKALEIMEQFYDANYPSKSLMVKAQRALIEADLEDYAEL